MRLSPKTNSPTQDLVMTPEDLARKCIDALELTPGLKLLDPAKGQGAFYNNFPASCENHYYEITEGKDFLSQNDSLRYDYIITNPPWSKMRPFLQKSMSISNNVCFLAPITNFVTKARLRDIESSGFYVKSVYIVKDYPKDWPSSGFQLAFVHLSRGQFNLSLTKWSTV